MRAGARAGVITAASIAVAVVVVLANAACPAFFAKVPVDDVNAAFVLADATWFESEETLFVFYRVGAEQGISNDTEIELAFRTDDEIVDFTPLEDFTPVHTHVPVDCGVNGRCGSMSVHVPIPPRDVQIQMRYKKGSAMVLPAPVTFNIVERGNPLRPNRSLLVYGVFDADDAHVQWRARHLFPDIRNEEATKLGLRRHFEVDGASYGDDLSGVFSVDDAYGYGATADCGVGGGAFTDLGWSRVQTDNRAVFNPEEMPLASSRFGTVCGVSTVTDATAAGTWDAVAFARKNPEVQDAFPVLHSPILQPAVIPFFLTECNQEIGNDLHERTQRNRLLLPDDAPVICVDDFSNANFVDDLSQQFRQAIDDKRTDGDDMVLVFALHHSDDTGALAQAVQDALAPVMSAEEAKASPRAVGAFVYDTFGAAVTDADLARVVLWCPADLGPDLDNIDDASLRACPLLPDQPDLKLGPFRFNQLPILPTKAQLETFVNKYSEAQAGSVTDLVFKAPVRTATSHDVHTGRTGLVTFFNEESITTNPSESFSFCSPDDPGSIDAIRFRSTTNGVDHHNHALSELPAFHAANPTADLDLGVKWDFSFLTRMKYNASIAGAATAVGVTIPFGISSQTEEFLGNATWDAADFPIGDALLRCTRFCDHPTFDSAGVYNALQPFSATYQNLCYRPKFPALPGAGFPSDP